MNNIIEKIKTEEQITFIENTFLSLYTKELNLIKVDAPIIVESGKGINDDLNGVERPIKFDTKDGSIPCEIVQSLAKWKRMKITEYNMEPETGIITNMTAIRMDEKMDDIHSIIVKQWDYELSIKETDRNIEYLKMIVKRIYKVLYEVTKLVEEKYNIQNTLPPNIQFIHSEELYNKYPNLTPKQREDEICKEFGAVFIIGIGSKILNTNQEHDLRAPDYDDWTTLTNAEKEFRGLNGDILVWNTVLGRAFEVSSMGIRVNKESLNEQLKLTNTENRKNLLYHKMLMDGQLKQTLGGGIGQSRLEMFCLHKKHIGEVISTVWSKEIRDECINKKINLL